MEHEQPLVDAHRSATLPREITIVVIFALALVLGVTGVIIYGYRAKSAWVGVSGKTVWDYLDLLFVPAVLAIGATVGASWFNWNQSERQKAAAEAQAKAAKDAETQRVQSEALQAYITEVGSLITEYGELSTEDPELELRYAEVKGNFKQANDKYSELSEWKKKVEHNIEQGMVDDRGMVDVGGGRRVNTELYKDLAQEQERQAEALRRKLVSIQEGMRLYRRARYTIRRSVIRAQTLTALERVGKQRKRAIMRLLTEAEVVQVGDRTGEDGVIPLRDADFSGADLSHMHLAQNSLQSIRFTKANLAGTDLTDADLSNADLTDADLSNANLTNARVTQDQLAKCKSLSGVTMPDRSKDP